MLRHGWWLGCVALLALSIALFAVSGTDDPARLP